VKERERDSVSSTIHQAEERIIELKFKHLKLFRGKEVKKVYGKFGIMSSDL
jgi:hypothetical protein